ncbi:MAG TPA: SIS domain-containing protein [Acidimicrobiales bacterium]|nr:SIS domain-containing protein [Acidimicrobiales bacterium]
MVANELSYLSEVKTLLDQLSDDVEPLLLAARWCAETVAAGGLVHVFGAGHSHMAAEEAFHRAGGLVPVNAVLVEWLMVHQGGRRASLLERQPGLGELIVSTEPVEQGDVFFVVSNSGRNPVPVEVAEAARARAAKVIAITSRQHSEGVAARGGRSVKLADVADLVLDNHAPLGDAAIAIEDGLVVGGVSSVMTLVIIQTIVVETVKLLVEQGAEPPVFKSGNVDGSDEWNAQQLKRLGRRVPTLLRSSIS